MVVTFLASLPLVAGFSAGLKNMPSYQTYAPYCNYTYWPQMGCSNWTLDPDSRRRTRCTDAGGNNRRMWWTGYPKVSPNITLRTGDGAESADPVTYNPGEILPLYVRVSDAHSKYGGLLIFAVNSTGDKVGDWVVTPNQKSVASTAPHHICNNSLMHVDPAAKNYLEVFYYKTPSKGTGQIWFYSLFKSGPPNPTRTGDFLYPRRNLTLQESSVVQAPDLVLLNSSTCDQTCRQRNLVCDSDVLASLDQQRIKTVITRLYPCDRAVYADCSTSAPYVSNGFCSYSNDSCGSFRRTEKPSCTTPASPTKQIICQCSEPKLSAASRFRPWSLLGTACLALLTSVQNPSRAFVLGLLSLTMLPFAAAHNWIEGTQGRAPMASTIFPTFPLLRLDKVHMQVEANQSVRIEWAAAHGDYTYFAVLSNEHVAHLEEIDYDLLEDYIKNAPSGSGQGEAQNDYWQQHHMTSVNIDLTSTDTANDWLTNVNAFESIVRPGNPNYWGDRPMKPLFKSNLCVTSFPGYVKPETGGFGKEGTQCDESLQMRYQQRHLVDDRRISYYSQKYPWLEAVHKYKHINYGYGQASAWIKVPARSGPGRYLVFYYWQGYRDNYDVDVVEPGKKVTEPYGRKINGTRYMVAEHCMFEQAQEFDSSCIEIVTTPKQCINICNNHPDWCKAVAVVPLRGPQPFPSVTEIPWGKHEGCNKSYFANLSEDTYVCYSITWFRDDANGALSPWTFYRDPNDIGFYSTCYIKDDPKEFQYPVKVISNEESSTFPFAYGEKCVSCDQRFATSSTDGFVKWKVLDCVDCDKYPTSNMYNPKVVVPTPSYVGAGFFNESAHTCVNSSCLKWLRPAGSTFAYFDECSALAARDPECAGYIVFDNKDRLGFGDTYHWRWSDNSMYEEYRQNCACWRKKACCTAPPQPWVQGQWWGNWSVHSVPK